MRLGLGLARVGYRQPSMSEVRFDVGASVKVRLRVRVRVRVRVKVRVRFRITF